MTTRSLLSPTRLLIAAAGLAVAVIATLLLLNWWMVSCGRLSCDITPAWAASAATPDSCPADLRSAATDPVWAKGIYNNLPDRQGTNKTTGWFFADGAATKKLTSGQGSRDSPDELWVAATKLLAAAPIANPPRGAAHPAASHVESKAAVWMRQSNITYTVAVINNHKGPCGEEVPQDFGCTQAVRAILPVGSTMVVWWWSDRDGRMMSTQYEGTAT